MYRFMHGFSFGLRWIAFVVFCFVVFTFVGTCHAQEPKYDTIFNLKSDLLNGDKDGFITDKFTKIGKDRVKMIPGSAPHTFGVDIIALKEFDEYCEVYIYMESRYDNKKKFSALIDVGSVGMGFNPQTVIKPVRIKVHFERRDEGKLFAFFSDLDNPDCEFGVKYEGAASVTVSILPGSDEFEIQELIIKRLSQAEIEAQKEKN